MCAVTMPISPPRSHAFRSSGSSQSCSQALGACIRCSAGDFLTMENVCGVLQVTFYVGILGRTPENSSAPPSDLLQQVARTILLEAVMSVFSRVAALGTAGAMSPSTESVEGSPGDAMLSVAMGILDLLLQWIPGEMRAGRGHGHP